MSLLATIALAATAAPAITVTPGRVVQELRPVAFAASPSGSRFAATMEDGSVRILDAKTRQTVRELARHPQPAYAVAWSPDGAYVATGDESARIFIEDVRTGAKIKEYRTHTKGIQKLSFNLPRTMLLSTGKDDEVKVYQVTGARGKELRAILGQGANFYGATFNPKNPYLFAVGILGSGAREYDPKTGLVKGFLTGHNNQGVFDIAFNPAGNRVLTAGRDGNAFLWDNQTNRRLATFKGHTDWIVDVEFSPNGLLAATCSTDRTVKVWNTKSFQKVADLQGQSATGFPICFTADGKSLITVTDGGYLQYNTITPSQAAPVPAPKAPVRPKRTPPKKSSRKRSRRG